MNKTATRNGKVEFWRFIFSVIIMIHHSRYLVGDKNCMFLGGSLAVEFFFLVSGYLMMASIDRKKDAPTALGRETIGFLGRKVKGLMPELLIAHLIAWLFVSFAKDYSLLQTVRLFVDTFFEVTQLKMSGLPSATVNGVTWYISSMLLSMAVLYPLLRKYPDMVAHVVVPLIALLLLGYLGGNYDNPRSPTSWIGLTFKGNLRAMGEICLGVICYLVCKPLSKLSLTRLGKWFVTLAEWVCYLVAIWYMYEMKATNLDYFVIVILMAGVVLTFSHQGADANLFDRRLFNILGKFSVNLFLCHTFYAQHLKRIIPKGWSDNRKMVLYILCTVATAFFVSAVAALLRRITPKVRGFAKQLLIKA